MTTNEQKQLNRYFENSIKELKAHAEVANKEMGEIKVAIAEIKTDMRWIKRGIWAVITPALGAIGIAILLLVQ